MNAIAAYMVFEYLDRELEEAARVRRSRPVDPRPSRIQRLRSAVASAVARRRSASAPAA